MGWLDLLRELGALLTVLGLLVGALWLVRRYGLTLQGLPQRQRRLAIVERLAIDGRASLTLVRRDGQEHLVLLSPHGALLVETGIPVAEAAPPANTHVPLPRPSLQGFELPAKLRHLPTGFAALVEKARATASRSAAA